MSRYFNNHEVELLAPAGNFEIFKQIIHSGADAIYFGGKVINMRLHRKDFNFTNEEILEAIQIAHSLNKKVYVTVNNLLDFNDVDVAHDYLRFLEKAQPDALIVQDFAILQIVKSLNLNLNIHSSVMMNVHNYETIKVLESLGVTRVVLSRDMDLNAIEILSAKTNMEFEYFAHGDMCVAHGAQCLYSGMLFGKSSNRGLCMKPCRWNYTMSKDGLAYNTKYPMAVKDLSLYEYIPELIQAGVVSFKIEGRMRDSEYLIKLINSYSDAINRYISDPICYERTQHSQEIFENRKRDLSTAYAFGKPGLKNINLRYEGTGKFYSTGKPFSYPVEEFSLSENRLNKINKVLAENVTSNESNNSPKLSVKVNSFDAAKIAIEEGIDTIYLSGEVFEPNKPFTKEEIIELTKNKNSSKIYMALPRMMFEEEFSKYNHLLRNNDLGIDGLLVTNLGAINKFSDLGLELIGDYSLNIHNPLSAEFFKSQGLKRITLSAESKVANTKDTLLKATLPTEIIVHGSPVVMYMSHDLYENTKVLSPSGKSDTKYSNPNILVLKDEKCYEHPIFRDALGRNHMILSKDLCYLPFLSNLANCGASYFRIEGCHYDNNTLKEVISLYKNALSNLSNSTEIFEALNLDNTHYTFGAFQFD